MQDFGKNNFPFLIRLGFVFLKIQGLFQTGVGLCHMATKVSIKIMYVLNLYFQIYHSQKQGSLKQHYRTL
jgi:hypothetical protein